MPKYFKYTNNSLKPFLYSNTCKGSRLNRKQWRHFYKKEVIRINVIEDHIELKWNGLVRVNLF